MAERVKIMFWLEEETRNYFIKRCIPSLSPATNTLKFKIDILFVGNDCLAIKGLKRIKYRFKKGLALTFLILLMHYLHLLGINSVFHRL